MRTKTDHRFIVDVDPEQVMGALLAVERVPDWSPSHKDVRVATHDDYGRPKRVYATVSPMGNSDRQVLEYDCTSDRISWHVVESGAGGGGMGWFEIEASNECTEVWYHSEFYLPIPVPGILMKRSIAKTNEEAVQNLIEFIEKFQFENYNAG